MADHIGFFEVGPDGIRFVAQLKHADIARCTFKIMVPEHYRSDGSCRCDDPTHTEMVDWGYEWHNGCWWGAVDDA